MPKSLPKSFRMASSEPESEETTHSAPAFEPGVRLGVDVGVVRVGLAASDPHLVLATPLRTVARDVKKDSDVRDIVAEVAQRDAKAVYVGLPRTLKGEEGSSAAMARDYAQKLANRLHAQSGATRSDVWLIDERLSTVDAHRSLHSAGLPMKKHREVIDQVAAAGILQQAIDAVRSGREPGELVAPEVEQNQKGAQ